MNTSVVVVLLNTKGLHLFNRLRVPSGNLAQLTLKIKITLIYNTYSEAVYQLFVIPGYICEQVNIHVKSVVLISEFFSNSFKAGKRLSERCTPLKLQLNQESHFQVIIEPTDLTFTVPLCFSESICRMRKSKS